MFAGVTGKSVYESDSIIKQSIENIVKKEEKIISDYKNLREFQKVANPTFISDLDKLLEERKIFLTYKIDSKEDQCKSLLKLLEYINTLDAKDKQLQSDILLDKINSIENETQPFKMVLLK
jgi:hypothetical protein